MDENDYNHQDKLKMYENLLRSYQEELEKKTKESMKLRVDLDFLNTKYTSLLNQNPNENTIITKPLQEELLQKNIHIENLKLTLGSLKDTLRKSEKKNSLFKMEIEKKEAFIKEILYEKKQVEMNFEEKCMELKENNKEFSDEKQEKEILQIENELDLSKNINKTLITLLKWKNIELEQIKNVNNQNNSEEDFEEMITKFKAQEQVLLKRLAQQMQDFAKLSNSSLEE